MLQSMKRVVRVFIITGGLGFSGLLLVLAFYGLGPCETGSELGDALFGASVLAFFLGGIGLAVCWLVWLASAVQRRVH